MILSTLHSADLSKYKDSMSPLIEKDIEQTERELKGAISQRYESKRIKQEMEKSNEV